MQKQPFFTQQVTYRFLLLKCQSIFVNLFSQHKRIWVIAWRESTRFTRVVIVSEIMTLEYTISLLELESSVTISECTRFLCCESYYNYYYRRVHYTIVMNWLNLPFSLKQHGYKSPSYYSHVKFFLW